MFWRCKDMKFCSSPYKTYIPNHLKTEFTIIQIIHFYINLWQLWKYILILVFQESLGLFHLKEYCYITAHNIDVAKNMLIAFWVRVLYSDNADKRRCKYYLRFSNRRILDVRTFVKVHLCMTENGRRTRNSRFNYCPIVSSLDLGEMLWV